ncbi:MAG TPA: molybdopterin cofactor-binding domain-containing protein [Thermoplasmata archaeon]|nr:molybdopterin cofactor-binding domain-containing protein [Thermoplasmata archaeon]
MIAGRPRRPWDRTDPGERDYFEILGDGLVAQVAPRKAGASGAGGWSPPIGGAWVHVGADGVVHAFTGKAEVGQGTRVALALVVAEELRVPLERVDLVMADTDLCPWDIGTFGSRSMADAAPALRAAATEARSALVERAARQGLGAPSALEAVDGEVRVRDGPGSVRYGDLVRGARDLVTVPAETSLTPPAAWSRAGRPVVDPHAEDVVTGSRAFASDLRRPGMQFGAFLQPPRYGARLTAVDVDRARARPGVTVVHEGEFVGVVAPSPGAARAALGDVEADWELRPQPGEEEIEGYLRAHPSSGDSWDTAERRAGAPASAFAAAPVKVEAVYRTAYIAHVPLETRAALAEWTDGRLTVWVGTQTPFRAREFVADGLGLPLEDIRVIAPFTGSGFGGKHGGAIALAAARLARAAKAPVLLTFSREEEFRHGYFRPMAIMDVRVGAARDGRLVAWSFHNVNAGAAAIFPPYTIPNQLVDNELSDSPLPQDPYRALAANANNFARESAVDEVAAAVGGDPLTIREKNLEDERLLTVLRTAATAAGWADRRRVPGKGYGLAIGLEKGGRVATVAEVTVTPDRAVKVDRLVLAYEAGAIVHPANLRSQVEGAAVMALGGALFEAIHFAGGRILNDRLGTYRVPRFSDLPSVEVHLVDRNDLPSAGAGETPMIAVAPAVANAIFDATGCRLRALPLVPEGKLPTPSDGPRPPGPPQDPRG